jgi:hypothetical protein
MPGKGGACVIADTQGLLMIWTMGGKSSLAGQGLLRAGSLGNGVCPRGVK